MADAPNRLNRADRRDRVAEMRLRGRTMRAIATDLRVSAATVASDLKAIETVWISSSAEAIGKAKGREVARLEMVIAEAWDAWEDSKKPQIRTTDDPDQQTKVTTVFSSGNVRFLELIVTSISQICRILGVNSASEVNVTVKRYIESAAVELGMSPGDLQRQIDEVTEDAWNKSWVSPVG